MFWNEWAKALKDTANLPSGTEENNFLENYKDLWQEKMIEFTENRNVEFRVCHKNGGFKENIEIIKMWKTFGEDKVNSKI